MSDAESTASFKRVAFLAGAALLFVLFCSLGTWQVQRLGWKLDLIERVQTRAYAPPVGLPDPQAWAGVQAATHEYQRVRLRGTWLPQLSTYTQAATALGSGYWLLTPLKTDRGFTVWVNRGFVPPRFVDPLKKTAGKPTPVQVTGLLRMAEPGGGFLRHNDPAAARWYSRDIAAMNAQLQLADAAPFFVDALPDDASGASHPGKLIHRDDSGEVRTDLSKITQPVAGLTVLTFKNNHLMYAITWYALALMVAGISWWLMRQSRPSV